MVIIDEASQALEAQCWVPSLSAQKLVLAGDHLQLPLTIKSSNMHPDPEISNFKLHESEPNQKLKLKTTIFDHLLTLHGPSIKRMLPIQYRMHEKIMRFPSDEMYGSRLIAAEAVKARLLTSLPYPLPRTVPVTHRNLQAKPVPWYNWSYTAQMRKRSRKS